MKLLEQLVGALGDNLTSSETFWMTAILVDWMFWIEEGHKSCLIASGKAYSNTLALLTPDDYLFCYTADLELSRRGQRMKHEALAEQSA